MRRPFDGNDRLAQTQAKLLFSHDPKRLNDGGGCRIQFWLGRTQPVGYGETDRGQYDRPARCVAGGGAMMVRTEVFCRLGGFDEAFSPTGPEDLDFSLRAYAAGYHAVFVPEAVAYHTPSHTRPVGYSPVLRVRLWWEFCRRHAGPAQRLGFLLFGAPLMYARTHIYLWLRSRGAGTRVRE
jgi:GT2 family glycosyltransferase